VQSLVGNLASGERRHVAEVTKPIRETRWNLLWCLKFPNLS